MYRIEEFNEKSFALNGIPYTKVYQLRYNNNSFSLVNIYDSTDVLFKDVSIENIIIQHKQLDVVKEIFKAFEYFK